jgi:putative hydrolase of the HAD superfamily
MIKAVIFDIYGTLLKKNVAGDLDDTLARKDIMLVSFNKIKKKYKLNASSEELFNLFTNYIKEDHKKKEKKGVYKPEVKIEKIWHKILKKINRNFDIDEFKIAYDHEKCVERYLYPYTVQTLLKLKEKGISLGIVSNAQFYTIIDMKELLKKNKSKYLFNEYFDNKLCFYSFIEGYSKPNKKSFLKLKKELLTKEIRPNETLYIGNDMLNDIYTANRVGFKTCLTINSETKYRNVKVKPDYKIKKLIQIIDIVDNEKLELFNKNKFIYSKKVFKNIILPIIDKLLSCYNPSKTNIVGIQGGQGTGKTTLVLFLKDYFKKMGYNTEGFSLDDFYVSNKERIKLRDKYKDNVYYQIPRGAPGTHRVEKLYFTFKKIKKGKFFSLPYFDKSLYNGQGDILNKKKYVKQRPDFVFVDGFFLGLPNISSDEIYKICLKYNLDIKDYDSLLKDINVVSTKIKSYQKLWGFLDKIILLKEDSLLDENFSNLQLKWRLQQEVELKKRKGEAQTNEDIIDFVKLLMPFSYVCYEKLKPEIKIKINKNHIFYDVYVK